MILIKELIEGVLDNINKDLTLVSGYYNWRDEQDKMNKSIINEVKRKSLKEGIEQGIQKNQREIVINMYKKNISFDDMTELTNLSYEEVNKIIKESSNN